MPATRLRGTGRWWVAVAAGVVMWTGRGVEAARLRLLASDYMYDGETTYCWGARANVSSSDVSDGLIFVRGANSECPLKLHIALDDATQSVTVGQSVALSWTVAPAAAADSALFPVKDAPALLDKRTRQRATIIHSNVHTCHFGSRCDAYRQGETDTNASTNQVGNLSTTATTPVAFSTRDITFTTPGKHVLLAHIIVPGPTIDTRYDFAVFTTIEVAAATNGAARGGDVSVQGNGTGREPVAGDATATTKSSPSHAMSKSQVIVLSAVGAFLAVLLLIVAVYSRRYNRPLLCARKGDDSDLSSTKRSNYCVRGSNLRTRSSDWTELYAIDDMLPVSVRGGDDSNAIAILRDSSRQSTPCSTPTTLTDRTVADFRHDVARWDERSSASPITPSSSAILIAAIQDPDLISSTPANDCFVPLESLMLGSPPAVHTRAPSPVPSRPRWKKPFRSSGRKRRQQQSKNPPPEDSGDEQEADI